MSGDRLIREIHDLHDDLGQWLGSEAAQEVLTRIVEQHHPDFSMVTVDGGVVPLAQLKDELRAARYAAPRLMIQVVDIEVLVAGTEYAAARFRERHNGENRIEERFTTAVLVADADARNGWRWRAVHETRAGDAPV